MRRLKGLMKRNRGQRKPKFLWDSLEREAANVIGISRKGLIPLYGSVDGGAHQSIPHEYLVNNVFGEPVLDTIGPDPLAWERGTYPDGIPTYRSVWSLRDEVEAYLAKESPRGTDSGGEEKIDKKTTVPSRTKRTGGRRRGRYYAKLWKCLDFFYERETNGGFEYFMSPLTEIRADVRTYFNRHHRGVDLPGRSTLELRINEFISEKRRSES